MGLIKELSWASWARLGGGLGRLRGVLGRLGVVLGGVSGTSWGAFQALGRLGGALGRLGDVLGASWGRHAVYPFFF